MLIINVVKSLQLDRMPMRPTQIPVDGDKENQMNPLFGKPLSPNMMVSS